VRSDEELMMATARGDMDSFEELVLRHQDGAVGVAYRLRSDEDSAREAAQEAFLRVLESAPRYRPTASFRTYLYRILTRICIDVYRRHRHEPPPDAIPAVGETPPQAVERAEREERVRRAIAALPMRQRIALVLRHYEGMSYGEIARAMRLSPRAVDSLLSRARAQLRQALSDLL